MDEKTQLNGPDRRRLNKNFEEILIFIKDKQENK